MPDRRMVSNKQQITVRIKGVRDGLLVTFGEGEWPELQEALFSHIEERENFFNGAKVALDVGNHILHAAEMGSLRDRLSDKGVILWAILSNSPTTEATAQMLGLATRLSSPKPERVVRSIDAKSARRRSCAGAAHASFRISCSLSRPRDCHWRREPRRRDHRLGQRSRLGAFAWSRPCWRRG